MGAGADGAGTVGVNAAHGLSAWGVHTTVLDRSINRLRYLDDVFGRSFKNAYASEGNTIELARQADLIIGAVLVVGGFGSLDAALAAALLLPAGAWLALGAGLSSLLTVLKLAPLVGLAVLDSALGHRLVPIVSPR